jgi:hypothetical protein
MSLKANRIVFNIHKFPKLKKAAEKENHAFSDYMV